MASFGSPGIWGKLKNFDAYPKTMESFRIKTLHGAVVTIISSLIMLSLFLSELSYFLTLDVRQELFVDTGRSQGERLRINIDIVFPKWPCAYLSIDAMDISGEHQFDLQHSIYKTRVDSDGNKINENDEGEKTEPGEGKIDIEALTNSSQESSVEVQTDTPTDSCLSCYGAETDSMPCCNTCEQVREAYRRKGWAISDHDVIDQCANEGWKKNFESQADEGCVVQGYLEVSKVAGNFHFAPGHSYQQQSVHVHDLHLFGKNAKFNITHKVNKLSFGHEYPGMDNPLDGHLELDEEGDKQQQEGNSMYQYFVKIVPTHYWKSNGTVLRTNQYSVTKHKRKIKLSIAENGLPGVFFIYDINPMMIQLREGRKSFLHFLTGVCAIIGGIFTVAGMIDGLIYQSKKSLQKKIDLGKAT